MFFYQISELIQIYHSNTCSTSTNAFCYFSLQWKRQIWIFSKWKFISQVPTEQWKLVSLSDLFVFRVYSRIAGRSQDQIFDNFSPICSQLHITFLSEKYICQRKELQNQVLPFLGGICLQMNWWLRRVIFLGATRVWWCFLS